MTYEFLVQMPRVVIMFAIKSDSSKLVIFQNLITVVGFSQAWIHSTPIVISGKVGKDPPRYIGQNFILIHNTQFLQIPFGSMAPLHLSSWNNWLRFGIISYFAATYYLSYQVVNGTKLKTCESAVKSRARIIHFILLAQLVVQLLVTRSLGAAEQRVR